MLEKHLPLVRAVVSRIAGALPSHVCRDDLESAGLVGLHSAVQRYNPKFGATFETYARVRIRGAILDELRELDWVPRSVHTKARKVEAARQKLEQVKGTEPTDEDMAEELQLGIVDYHSLLNSIQPPVFIHLDSERDADSNGSALRHESIIDEGQIDPSQSAMMREITRIATDWPDVLPEAQRRVLTLYYFEDLDMCEVGKLLGLTTSRISQLHTQAILSLRQFLLVKDATVA